MKKIIYVWILCMVSFSQISCKNKWKISMDEFNQFPSYDEAVGHVFDTYNMSVLSSQYYFSFARKPEGWFLVLREVGDINKVKQEAFWLSGTKKFQDLPSVKKKTEGLDNDPRMRGYYLSRYTKYNFTIYPFFGYIGHNVDNIAFLEHYKNQLSDTLTYALGKAYSRHANEYILAQYEESDTSLRKITDPANQVLDDAHAKKFLEFQKKSVQTMEALAKKNPSFETNIGNIQVKAGHERMSAYINLIMFGRKEEAKTFLENIHYPEFLMEVAENMLASCAPNAVLFTGGDSDFFTILYVQAHKGIRKDVKVINYGLMNLPEYVNMLTKSYLDIPGLTFSTPMKTYFDVRMAAPYMIAASDTIPAMMVLTSLKNAYEKPGGAGDQLNYGVYAENLMVGRDPSRLIYAHIDKKSLSRADLAFLDMVNEAYHTTRFYFAASYDNASNMLKNHTMLEGLVYALGDSSSEFNHYTSVNLDKTMELLLNVYQYKDSDRAETYEMPPNNTFQNLYKSVCYSAVRKAMDNVRVEDARKIFRFYFEKFPPGIAPVSQMDYSFLLIGKDLEELTTVAMLKSNLKDFYQREMKKYKPDDEIYQNYQFYLQKLEIL